MERAQRRQRQQWREKHEIAHFEDHLLDFSDCVLASEFEEDDLVTLKADALDQLIGRVTRAYNAHVGAGANACDASFVGILQHGMLHDDAAAPDAAVCLVDLLDKTICGGSALLRKDLFNRLFSIALNMATVPSGVAVVAAVMATGRILDASTLTDNDCVSVLTAVELPGGLEALRPILPAVLSVLDGRKAEPCSQGDIIYGDLALMRSRLGHFEGVRALLHRGVAGPGGPWRHTCTDFVRVWGDRMARRHDLPMHELLVTKALSEPRDKWPVQDPCFAPIAREVTRWHDRVLCRAWLEAVCMHGEC